MIKMIIDRSLVSHLKALGKHFPIISLTGPRQAGKTTLLKELYSNYEYISLENPDIRSQAEGDPRTFLSRFITEIKSKRTFKPSLATSLNKIAKLSDVNTEKYIIYGGKSDFSFRI